MIRYRRINFSRKVVLSLFILVTVCASAWGQDEHWLRETLTQKFSEEVVKSEISRNFSVYSDLYKLDLNGDGYKEGITFEASDSGHFVHFFNPHLVKEKSFFLESLGHKSHVQKIELRRISTEEHALLIFFYEGLNSYISLQSKVRLYVIYIPEKGVIENIFRGPVIYEERLKNGHYHTRNYNVTLEDLNKDGVKEILIKFSKNERVIILDKDKNWRLI